MGRPLRAVVTAVILMLPIGLAGGCGGVDLDPSHRSDVMIALPGAESLDYVSRGSHRESLSYVVAGEEPAADEIAALGLQLSKAGWNEVADNFGGKWSHVTQRMPSGVIENLRCTRRTWRLERDLVSYSICSDARQAGKLSIMAWRRRAGS